MYVFFLKEIHSSYRLNGGPFSFIPQGLSAYLVPSSPPIDSKETTLELDDTTGQHTPHNNPFDSS